MIAEKRTLSGICLEAFFFHVKICDRVYVNLLHIFGTEQQLKEPVYTTGRMIFL